MWKNRLALFAILFLITSLITIPFSQSFASSNPQIFSMTIQLFMVTTDKPCEEIGLDVRKHYSELIKQYFENYGYLWVYVDHSCATVEEIKSDAFFQYNPQNDLVIFIPDKQESKEYISLGTRLGHFGWTTNPPEIWSTTSFLGADGRQEIWVLSSELSHYILFNLGYQPNVWKGDDQIWNGAQKSYVHQIDDGFFECARETIPYSCSNHKIKLSSGKTSEVMAIYDKPVPISVSIVEYYIDDTITVKGEITNYDPRISDEVTLTITSPNGALLLIEQVEPNYYDGTFSISMNPEKSILSISGNYKISAKYSTASDIVSFGFKAESSTPVYIPPEQPTPVQPAPESTPEERGQVVPQTLLIYVETDKDEYKIGEQLKITGHLKEWYGSGGEATVSLCQRSTVGCELIGKTDADVSEKYIHKNIDTSSFTSGIIQIDLEYKNYAGDKIQKGAMSIQILDSSKPDPIMMSPTVPEQPSVQSSPLLNKKSCEEQGKIMMDGVCVTVTYETQEDPEKPVELEKPIEPEKPVETEKQKFCFLWWCWYF